MFRLIYSHYQANYKTKTKCSRLHSCPFVSLVMFFALSCLSSLPHFFHTFFCLSAACFILASLIFLLCIFLYIKNESGPGYLSRYSDFLRAGQSGDRVRVRTRFSEPVQTGPGAHSAPSTMSTGSLSGVYSGWGAEFPIHLHLAPRLKKEYRYTSTLLLAFMTCSRTIFTSYIIWNKFRRT